MVTAWRSLLWWYPVLTVSAELRSLHTFMIDKTATGSISRQETVSMLPPFLLNVQPHHVVRSADTCVLCGAVGLTFEWESLCRRDLFAGCICHNVISQHGKLLLQ